MFIKTFYNDPNQVHGTFSSKVIMKKLSRNSTNINLLSASDMAIRLLLS